jgi:tRNA(Leu) C34 or U34 (ribose-2'-O)-methylase TrmL
MTQSELQDIASKKLGTSLTATEDKYCTFDAYSDSYVVEFKCRRTHYDTQLIEHKKFTANLDQANESGKEFLYIISTPSGEYIFNVSTLVEEGYDFGWEDRSMPSKTDFGGSHRLNKRVGYIDVRSSSVS